MSILDKFVKRSFDILISFLGILLTFLIMFIAWAVATVETKSNGFFIQRRIGLNGKAFSILKIKTMKKIDGIDTTITSSNDIRITKSGKLFRNTKIDELPQLLNVFVGDMSFVGPRPDVAGYADKLLGDDRIILSIRPGITGPASLKYKNEEEILANQSNPKIYNDTVIWPDKVNINKEYIQNWSFKLDLHYLIRTIR